MSNLTNNSSPVTLHFEGKNFDCPQSANEFLVPIKPICEIIQVDFKKQLRKLKINEYWNQLYTLGYTVAQDGKQRSMACLPIFEVNEWIQSISKNNRTSESLEMTERLKKYLRSCRIKYVSSLEQNQIDPRDSENRKALQPVIEARKFNRYKRSEYLKKLMENPNFQAIQECDRMEKKYNAQIKNYLKGLEEQLSLFEDGNQAIIDD